MCDQWQGSQGRIIPPGEADEPNMCYIEMPPTWFAEDASQYQHFLRAHDFSHFCQDYDPEIMHVNVGYPDEYAYFQGQCSFLDAKRAEDLGLAKRMQA